MRSSTDKRDGHLSAKHISLSALIKAAYNIRAPSGDQLIGGSGWVDREYFDIEAKAASSMVESTSKLSRKDFVQQFQLMLQSLLEDRF
jgi:uncharacterized protein (TIGR03435 family)